MRPHGDTNRGCAPPVRPLPPGKSGALVAVCWLLLLAYLIVMVRMLAPVIAGGAPGPPQ